MRPIEKTVLAGRARFCSLYVLGVSTRLEGIVRDFLREWAVPLVVATVFHLTLCFVACKATERFMQFAQDVRTVADYIEKGN
jgi:hypothetical protein